MSLSNKINITPKLTSSYYDKKINLSGKFKSFSGMTCISMCCGNDQHGNYFPTNLKSIEKLFNTSIILQKHFQSVPHSSYHMTIFGFQNDHIVKRNLIQTDINKLRSLSNYQFPLKLKIVNIFIGKTLGIDVEFVCHELRHFYNKWNQEKKYPFHITLAYKRTDQPIPFQDKIFHREIHQLRDLINENEFYVSMPQIMTYDSLDYFYPL